MNRNFVVCLTGCFLAALVVFGAAHASLDRTEIEEVQRIIERDLTELENFTQLVDDLEHVAEQSSNATRRNVIQELQQAMVREILILEERVGEEYVIRQHGKGPIDREDRLKVGGNTYPMESRIFKKQYKTGGISHKPALNRLARMQSTYVVCKRISNEAISKHDRALPAYIERVNEFASLMGQEIDSARALLPPKDKEEDEEE